MSRALRTALVLGAVALAACASSPAHTPLAGASDDDTHDAAPLTPDTSPIGLRRSLVADEYFWLRAKALEGDAPPPFKDALAAMIELRADLSADATAWEDLEVPLGAVARASELTAAYGELPRTRDVAGKVVPLRAHALRLSRALEATENAYRAGPYREHEAEIARAAKDLGEHFLPKIETILRAVEVDLALPGASRPIVLTLVSDAPYPGIFAADARGRATASFVRVHGIEGGLLWETALHESLHAIDELTVRLPTAMNTLRKALVKRGLADAESDIEMIVNTITFAEAASLVRRFVDPKHRPMGEGHFYTLYPPAAAIVAAWDRHIAGAPMEETADVIAQAVTNTPP